ncbi:hypothetical protein LLE49_11955 [Alicyclobacillus tolerans]|uniref:hypothetical protein n=1 Tax=Alicyclobacillus tolerans TaxID=90970 RepID=UPI001F29E702|nr:hypothetical protein [Alicyclobacillus tolerans]MCF8565431.1 hypothetical protein [Alicyclobacillus tolerans]
MRYKQPESQNGVTIFISIAFVVAVAVVLSVGLNADSFDWWVSGQGTYMPLALIVLGAAALMGIVLAVGHFTGNRPPLYAAGMIHGIIAVVGVVFLIASMLNGARGTDIQISLVLFLIAVAMGLLFFVYRLRSKVIPNTFIVVHALLAVVGYVFLLRA